jgi:ActR/RegA family two-component response regulator
MPTLLIVDDEANILTSLERALSREDSQVECAATLDEARAKLRDAFDFVLLDVWFPHGSGLDLLAEIVPAAPDTTVIMMSGHATIDTAVQATKLGAFDFLEKPVALERLLVVLRNAAAARALQAENRRLQRPGPASIVGRSPAIQKLVEEIQRAGPTAARVLIQGEHGTGKELVARELHELSPRRHGPFVAVNCAAIPETLIESELFGHERGAFTGAAQARRGRFEEAHGGTLFLDEVGDLSPQAQTKLLRVLQEGELARLGGNRAIRVDVRVLAATNRDLAAAIAAERFREDLYFRLAVIPIVVPPGRALREGVGPRVHPARAHVLGGGHRSVAPLRVPRKRARAAQPGRAALDHDAGDENRRRARAGGAAPRRVVPRDSARRVGAGVREEANRSRTTGGRRQHDPRRRPAGPRAEPSVQEDEEARLAGGAVRPRTAKVPRGSPAPKAQRARGTRRSGAAARFTASISVSWPRRST